jgi:peptidoglycan/LPS O-acetylase OafA/YrhL
VSTDVQVRESSAGRRFAEAEGLRAVAALAIVVFHVGVAAGVVGGTGPAGPYVQHLNVGVSVFFVLSAFLLYRPFVAARLSGDAAPRTGPYLWRRALRILPGYWVALFLGVYVVEQSTLGPARHIVLYVTLTQIYSAATALGGLVVAWSLCTEASFYAYLPLHAWVMRRWSAGDLESKVRGEYLVCAGLYAVSILFKVFVRSDHELTSTWLPSFLDTFALGMALAVATVAAERRGAPGPASRFVAAFPGRVWAGALLLYLLIANIDYPAGLDDPVTSFQYVSHQSLFGLVAVALVAPAVLATGSGGPVGAVLRSRPAQWVGRISFGIFLWHLPIVGRLDADLAPAGATSLPFFELLGLTLLVTLAIALASWTLVERPLLRLKAWGPGRQG